MCSYLILVGATQREWRSDTSSAEMQQVVIKLHLD